MPKNVQTTIQVCTYFTCQQANAQNPSSQTSTVHEPRTLQMVKKDSENLEEGIRDQTANIHWIREREREFQKNICFCFADYTKAFDCVDYNQKILKEMGIPDHLTCLLRNLYAGQEATVRTRYRIIYVKVTTDWFKIGKVVCQGCILSSCLFNLKSEHII